MDQFSVLVQLQKPDMALAQRMLSSVLAQSINGWELVLVVGAGSTEDLAAARQLAKNQLHVRVESRPEGELLAWSCNALLPTLGDWVGFLGQHDQLTPHALERMAATIAAHPQARVIYSDEESLGTWGQISLQTAKGAPDPIRLLSEEYLRDLAMIQKSWFISAGSFDRQASDYPTHDLYLRLMESVGVSGFAYTPQILYRRHRNRLIPRVDPRDKPYLPGYDLQGVRRHYDRVGISAKIKQLNGTVDTELQFLPAPSVTILLVLGDDLAEGRARLASIGLAPLYQPRNVQVLFHGEQEEAFRHSIHLCQGLKYPIRRITGSLSEGLNQAISGADTDLTVILKGQALNARWLQRLVHLTQLPGISAASPTLITPIHQADGGPWDARGHLNQLAVPHSVSVLAPACLLVDTRTFQELGGFEPGYPTLYAMDFSLRLSRSGGGCARTPHAQVQVSPEAAPEPGELTAFRAAWAGWEDPYGLHQLP